MGFGEHGDIILQRVLHWFTSAPTHSEAQDPSATTLEAWLVYPRFLYTQVGWPVVLLGVSGVGLFLHEKLDSLKHHHALLLVAFIIYVYLFFTVLPNKDNRYTMPLLPAFIIFAAYATTRSADLISGLVPSTRHLRTAVVVVLLIVSAAGAAHATTTAAPYPAPDAGTKTTADIIRDHGPATVVVDNQRNWVSRGAITFYVAAHDPELEYNVTHAAYLDSADWVVSANKTTYDGFSLYRVVEKDRKIYIYKRSRSGT
jgi:4-amino-4-deoxy-L-arabinose transferase-like glycosyltransferase